MGAKDYLTTAEAAKVLGVPAWRVRTSVDRLWPDLPRACRVRLIPQSFLPKLQQWLQEKGFMK